jgi:Ser/Thr protein kinase RdoA (MazF antagonist)
MGRKITSGKRDNRSNPPRGILAQYDLGEVQAVKPKKGGGIDESFVVTSDSGQYFLKRRSPDYTPDMVDCDHALIQFLVSHGFPTPAVMPTRHGDTWVEWEGRIYEAYTYVEGSGYAIGDLQQMVSLGHTVARYHRLVSQYKPPRLKLPPWKDSSVAGFLDLGGYVTPRLKTLLAHSRIGEQEARFVCDVTRQLKARAEQMRRGTDLASLTVHGALEPGNVLFDEEGEVVAWVDWADSAQFVRVFDVAHALLKFAGRRPDAVLPGQVGPSLPWSSVESFATAYRQEVKLTEAESSSLPWLMLGIRIVDALWVAESTPMDYRRELSLAKELRTWLTQHAPAIRGAFR